MAIPDATRPMSTGEAKAPAEMRMRPAAPPTAPAIALRTGNVELPPLGAGQRWAHGLHGPVLLGVLNLLGPRPMLDPSAP